MNAQLLGILFFAMVAGIIMGVLQVLSGFFLESTLKFVPVYLLYLLVVLLRPTELEAIAGERCGGGLSGGGGTVFPTAQQAAQ